MNDWLPARRRPTPWVWLLGALITLGDGRVGPADRFVARAVTDLAGLAADGRRFATTIGEAMTVHVADARAALAALRS